MPRFWLGTALAFALAACGQNGANRPCMNMTGQSQLVTDAAMLRVDVYDGSVACSAIGTAAPILTREFGKGTPIEIDLKAGTRTIVLTAFSASNLAVGQACTTAMLGKGSNLCFDLVVAPLVPPDLAGLDGPIAPTDGGTDGGVTDGGAGDAGDPDLAVELDMTSEPDLTIPNDLTPPSDLLPVDLIPPADLKPECTPSSVGVDCAPNLLCCNNKCVPKTTSTNCGACGSGCNAANGTATCATGSCVVACALGFENCDKDGSNGCEIDLTNDPNHCGSCTRACSTTQTDVLDCSNGTCNSTCTSSHMNCSQPSSATADNGCECEGNACCGGTTCQSKHDTGTSQTWFNCTNTGTINGTQALASCQQYAGSDAENCKFLVCDGDQQDKLVCNTFHNGALGCCCWWYAGDDGEKDYPGGVTCTAGNACLCTPPTRTWN